MERNEIIIRNAIVHILDSTLGMPVLSDVLLDTGPDWNDYLREHIYNIASSYDIKDGTFYKEESYVYKKLANFREENLISVSKDIASYLYNIMNQSIDILPADLIVVTYQVNGIVYLALLKMNYKECYIHYSDSDGSENSNEIIKQRASFPSKTTKLSEAALINLEDYSIELVEKKYEINGVKVHYLSQIFLQCMPKLSSKETLNIVTKAVEQIHKKYYEENFDRLMEAKRIIYNESIEEGVIRVEAIGEKLFNENPEIKVEFTQKLKKYNLASAEIELKNKHNAKKFKKQFLITDAGIEIVIPMEEYNNKNVEFITDQDGMMSVLIQNINHISSK